MPTTNTAIPDNYKNSFIALAESGDQQWRAAASLFDTMLSDAAAEQINLPKMRAYQDVASLLGVKSVTVRTWSAVYHAAGDALLDEFSDTFRFAHWRAMMTYAKRKGKPLEDVARELAATADEYGGMPIPVDVIAAQAVSAPKTSAEIFDEELDRALAALTVASRHVPKAFKEPFDAAVQALTDAVIALRKLQERK